MRKGAHRENARIWQSLIRTLFCLNLCRRGGRKWALLGPLWGSSGAPSLPPKPAAASVQDRLGAASLGQLLSCPYALSSAPSCSPRAADACHLPGGFSRNSRGTRGQAPTITEEDRQRFSATLRARDKRHLADLSPSQTSGFQGQVASCTGPRTTGPALVSGNWPVLGPRWVNRNDQRGPAP